VFLRRLESARKDVEHAILLNPSDPVPHSEMLTIARGMQLEKGLVLEHLEHARRLSPELWEPHVRTLFFLCEKWQGSHEEMFEFARSTSNSAVDGSGLHALIACAHIERWLYFDAFEGNRAEADQYWQQPNVKNEIIDA
jgi:hypothetical protein